MNIVDIFLDYYQYFLIGTRTTIVVSIITVFFGALIGCVIALLRLSNFKPFQLFAKLYITVIRGTPLLVQLYIVYYQLNFIPYPDTTFLGVELGRILPCVLALSLNSGAYIAEIIRAGIQAVDFGQTEAALSCGMTKGQAMRYIIMPQAIKNILPALCNEGIAVLKETSICGLISVVDLTRAGDLIRSRTMSPYFTLISVAAVYFILVFGLSKAVKRLERRLAQSDRH